MTVVYEGWRLLPLQQFQRDTLFQNTKEPDSRTTLVSTVYKDLKEKSLPLLVLAQQDHTIVELRLETGYHPDRPWVLAFSAHSLAFQKATESLDTIHKVWASTIITFHDRLAWKEASLADSLPKDLLPWLEQQKDDFYKNHPIS